MMMSPFSRHFKWLFTLVAILILFIKFKLASVFIIRSRTWFSLSFNKSTRTTNLTTNDTFARMSKLERENAWVDYTDTAF